MSAPKTRWRTGERPGIAERVTSMAEADPRAFDFEKALLSLDRAGALSILEEAAGEMPSVNAVERVVVPALERIGRGWESGKIALSQVYMSGKICEELVDTVLPPGDPSRKGQPRMAIATLEDYHLLGKRIVYATLRASGYELDDYGHGLSAEELSDRVVADEVELLLVSTLMLRSALRLADVRRLLDTSGREVKIIAGGAPFSFDARLGEGVGADAVCRTASEVLGAIEEVTGGDHGG